MLKILKGVFLAAFAGCCWGSMAVAAQYLFTDCGFQARHLTTLRLIEPAFCYWHFKLLLEDSKAF